ncbi:MAG TPA: deoxyribose-phosphate aldolase [Bacillota bacterium]|nr:deoxyribose-phosphate aldolase [Bacillota bacterium]
MSKIGKSKLASMIDHTYLKPQGTKKQVKDLCQQAIAHSFASVCINPCFVELAADRLRESPVKVCTVIGFPLGANNRDTKAYECKRALEDGAREIDMVINIGALKDGRFDYVENDIRQVVEASGEAIVKVIIETCFLTDEEKVTACKLAQSAGADFVKTSTGFGSGGANAADVRLMKETVDGLMGVKASGGVRSLADALTMIKAGATRLGTSSGIDILKELLEP